MSVLCHTTYFVDSLVTQLPTLMSVLRYSLLCQFHSQYKTIQINLFPNAQLPVIVWSLYWPSHPVDIFLPGQLCVWPCNVREVVGLPHVPALGEKLHFL